VQAREQQRQSNSSSISSGVDPRSRNLENTENRLSKKRTKRKGKRKKKNARRNGVRKPEATLVNRQTEAASRKFSSSLYNVT